MTSTHKPGLDRRAAWLAVVVALAGFVAVAVTVVPWDWVPGGQLTPMPADELFTPKQIDRAEEFSSYRRLLSLSGYAVSLVIAGLLGFTHIGARLTRRSMPRLPWWLAVGAATLMFLLAGRLAVLPFSLLLRDQSLEYGLTTQPVTSWLLDQGKGLLVSSAMTSVLLIVIVGLARRYPRRWFAPAGAVAAGLVFAGSFLYPVLVEPLFNDFESMQPGPLRSTVIELADRESLKIEDVLIADASKRTTTLNAYVSGLWGTRRVVVYDTLLDQMSPAQAKVVIAHELAHAKNRDVLVGTTLGAIGSIAGIAILALLMGSRRLRAFSGIPGLGDPAAVALLLALFSFGSLAASPVTNAVSRAIEMRADRSALQVTEDDQAFVDMQRELAVKAMHDPTPPGWSQFWFASHPTVLQRAGLPASLQAAMR